ncbi:hypothetical protein B0J11DRAFT_500829 [Dendryphion nanum]|uniref:Uncharacterized protein n=1 Tax=Dendryphion nanum TaxID=256645 RepID=A0A9P9J1E8_9PLEO|nr:hypothetical protein B0J11DRAFT_500829 [Dendryphion nanum]
MSQFNEHVMSKIKRCQVPPFRLARRPRYLTPCERNRFSRTYYQLWGLMQLSQASRSERLSKTTLRQLYNLYDIASIKVPIGDEVCERAKSWSSHFDASAQRERVRAEIWTMLENKCQHFHRCKPEDVWDYGVLDHGFDNHVVILDCYQDELKRTCYGFAIQDTKFTPEFVLKYLWDDE